MALRHANRKFMRGSVERHVALWVGRQYAVLPLAAMHLCRGKTDWPCGVQTVSSRTAQWSGMWPATFARHNAVLAIGRNAPVPGKDRLALRCANRKFTHGSVGGMWPATFARHDAVLAVGRNAPVPGIRPVSLAACKPEAHARLSGAACGPLRLPGMMPCWPLSAMRLCLEYNYAWNGLVPG